MQHAAIIILFCVLLAIALRRFIPLPLQIWHIMTIGALLTLFSQQITPYQAFHAINWQVIIYLFGVFLIGLSLEQSGYLEIIGYKLLSKLQNPKKLLFIMIIIFAISSALLMNDTIAIIGASIILLICRQHPQLSKPLLLALAFSITLGSLLTPIGNPQNLLIAESGQLTNPFISFFSHFILPTLVSLFITYLVILIFYRKVFATSFALNNSPTDITNPQLAKLCKLSLSLLVLMILLKTIFEAFNFPWKINFSAIAIVSCLPILIISKQRIELLKKLDWPSLIFFISMFILMKSVWDTGYFQALISANHIAVTNLLVILLIGILLSQLISNLPLVMLYLPLLINAHATSQNFLALAAGSTLAGNLLLLGAASNVLIVQTTESRKQYAFGFFEFARAGILLTILCFFVYYFWLRYF